MREAILEAVASILYSSSLCVLLVNKSAHNFGQLEFSSLGRVGKTTRAHRTVQRGHAIALPTLHFSWPRDNKSGGAGSAVWHPHAEDENDPLYYFCGNPFYVVSPCQLDTLFNNMEIQLPVSLI